MESPRPAKSWKGRAGWVGTWALGFSSIQLGPVFTVMFKIQAEAVKEGCGQLLGSPELASSTEPPPCCPCGGKGHSVHPVAPGRQPVRTSCPALRQGGRPTGAPAPDAKGPQSVGRQPTAQRGS